MVIMCFVCKIGLENIEDGSIKDFGKPLLGYRVDSISHDKETNRYQGIPAQWRLILNLEDDDYTADETVID